MIFQPIKKTIGIRLEAWEEKLGVDYVEHGILRDAYVRDLVNSGYPENQTTPQAASENRPSSLGDLSGHTSSNFLTIPRMASPAKTSTTLFITEIGSCSEGVVNTAMDAEAVQVSAPTPPIERHI